MSPNGAYPKVSGYCATYGRPPDLLEECIESFVRQDYPGPKELVVLNDWGECRLHCDAPGVRVFNLPQRLPTLGAKFNATIERCTGEILLPWEDDDIYLPWRISYSVAHLEDGLFHTNRAFFVDGGGALVRSENMFQCNLAIHRDRFAAVGFYADDDISAIDVDLFAKLGVQSSSVAWEDVYYVYRWSTTGSYHGSGWGGLAELTPRVTAFVREQRDRGQLPTGDVHLHPRWSRDWVADTRASLTNEGAP